MKSTKINKKEDGIGPFFKKTAAGLSQNSFRDSLATFPIGYTGITLNFRPHQCLRTLTNASGPLPMPLDTYQCLRNLTNASGPLPMPQEPHQCLRSLTNASRHLPMPQEPHQCLRNLTNASGPLPMPLDTYQYL